MSLRSTQSGECSNLFLPRHQEKQKQFPASRAVNAPSPCCLTATYAAPYSRTTPGLCLTVPLCSRWNLRLNVTSGMDAQAGRDRGLSDTIRRLPQYDSNAGR